MQEIERLEEGNATQLLVGNRVFMVVKLGMASVLFESFVSITDDGDGETGPYPETDSTFQEVMSGVGDESPEDVLRTYLAIEAEEEERRRAQFLAELSGRMVAAGAGVVDLA